MVSTAVNSDYFSSANIIHFLQKSWNASFEDSSNLQLNLNLSVHKGLFRVQLLYSGSSTPLLYANLTFPSSILTISERVHFESAVFSSDWRNHTKLYLFAHVLQSGNLFILDGGRQLEGVPGRHGGGRQEAIVDDNRGQSADSRS